MAVIGLSQIGGDVEVFLKNKRGIPHPVCGLIGGTKEKPRFIPDLATWGDRDSAVQEDNVMAEFNICPATTTDEFVRNTTAIRDHVKGLITNAGYSMSIVPSYEFTQEQLSSEQARQMGCMPDFNAWKFQQNPILRPEVLGNIRTAGGHIHISFDANVDRQDPAYAEVQAKFIRILDLYLGVPSILLDTDNRRREFYGKAGAYRPKNYGVEYRTLSNFWIANADLMKWVFTGVKSAVSTFNNSRNNLLSDNLSRNIIRIINNSDADAALDLILNNNINMPVAWYKAREAEGKKAAKSRI